MILATTTVEEYDRFLSIFSTKGADKRREHGSKGAQVFRDPNQDDRVWVLFDWDADGWQSFVSDPEVPPIMKEAGHKGPPQAAEVGAELRRVMDDSAELTRAPHQGRRDRRPDGSAVVHGHRERQRREDGRRRDQRRRRPAGAADRAVSSRTARRPTTSPRPAPPSSSRRITSM